MSNLRTTVRDLLHSHGIAPVGTTQDGDRVKVAYEYDDAGAVALAVIVLRDAGWLAYVELFRGQFREITAASPLGPPVDIGPSREAIARHRLASSVTFEHRGAK